METERDLIEESLSQPNEVQDRFDERISPKVMDIEDGLTDKNAITTIMKELREVVTLKQNFFIDNRHQKRQKFIIVIKRLTHPFTLLAFGYMATLLYNVKGFRFLKNQAQNLAPSITTLVIIALLLSLDVYLQIQKLNQKVIKVDMEITNIISKYEALCKYSKPLEQKLLKEKRQTKEFSYYQSCFTDTLRNKKWKQVPSNTLAQGDIIRLLKGDVAPTLIERIIFTPNSSQDNYSPESNVEWYNRGIRIGVSTDPTDDAQPQFKKDDDLNDVIKRNQRDFMYFRVENTPYIYDINQFITNTKSKESKNKELLYFKNLMYVDEVSTYFQSTLWLLVIVLTCIFYKSSIVKVVNDSESFDSIHLDEVFVLLIGIRFVAPIVVGMCEAWSNALMLGLFNKLQKDRVGDGVGFETHHQRKDAFIEKSLPQTSWYKRIICCGKAAQSHIKFKKKKQKRRKAEQKRQLIEKKRVEELEFDERQSFWSTVPEFFRFMNGGCNQSNNIVAQVSSVSIFAFVDKQGIVTENQKYIDEVAVINQNFEQVIIDLSHVALASDETKVYQAEGSEQKFEENCSQLNALGLAIMLSRNPKESDSDSQLQDIFLSETLKKTGFYFQKSMGRENDSHQDCGCALARLIGHPQTSYSSFEPIVSFWSMMPNHELTEDLDFKKDKIHQQQERLCKSHDESLKSASLDFSDLSSLKKQSEQSQDDVFDDMKPEYVEHKQQQQMLLERKNRYQHLICSIVQTKSTQRYQAFCRGEAITVLNNCTELWNGTDVIPIKDTLRKDIKDLCMQWEADDFDSIGFSYKPVTPDLTEEIKSCQINKQTYNKTLVNQQIKNQIFLGLIAIKHHKKIDAKNQIGEMEAAGIRPVLFSKEGVLETKSLAYELGLDNDWNSWISLSDNPSTLTQRINQDGNKVLPCGIQKVRDHLGEIDKIPLQVPLFCDVTEKATEQMFQIYQEHGDIVACIGNIYNSDNLHVFQQANVAIGMQVEPLYRCFRCNGRITSSIEKQNQTSVQIPSIKNQLLEHYKPSKLEQLSAELNWIACTFVFNANTNIQCFDKVFCESRRLRQAIESCLRIVYALYAVVILTQILNMILGMQSYLNLFQVLFLAIVSIPISAIFCLARPSDSQAMNYHVVSPKYLETKRFLGSTRYMIYTCSIQVILASLLLVSLQILQLGLINRYFGMQPNFIVRKWLSYSDNFQTQDLTASHEKSLALVQVTNLLCCTLVLQLLSISFEIPRLPKVAFNTPFLIQAMVQVLIVLSWFFIEAFSKQQTMPDQVQSVQKPSWQLAIGILITLLVIFFFSYHTSKVHKDKFLKDQQQLKILFETKLGMWSPK